MNSNSIRSHPRLYVSAEQLQRLRQPTLPTPLRTPAGQVVNEAEKFVRSPDFDYPHDTHNAHLVRARIAQTRTVTLLVRYFQTGDRRYRDAALAHIETIGNWEYWSWITWRKNNPDPNAIFDLSYGENSTTLAIAYDWLHAELTPAERTRFLDIALRRSFRSFLKNVDANTAWWFKRAQSNWNSVCAGGAGMLALAMHDDVPEAAEVLKRVEESIAVFFGSLEQTGGAWPEGIGYWNYGMRYAFMYLLSHERTTGQAHPLLARPAVRATLQFPVDFCPRGVPCSFGDVNLWRPLPIHYAVAQRLGADDILAALDTHLQNRPSYEDCWPNAAEMLLLHPRKTTRPPAQPRQRIKLYQGMDWGVLTNRQLTLTVRGGTTEVPHGHRDLLSFHAVVGDESLITSLGVGEYLDTTFSERRFEMFETMPASKNTLLINGVGITGKSTVTTTVVPNGLRIDATTAMGVMRDGPVAKFCGRRFHLLGDGALIVDRIELLHPGRAEARFHTFAKFKDGVLIGKRHRLGLAFASDVPATLHRATTAPTTPGKSATMLRWCSDKLNTTMTFVTWLVPGRAAGKLTLKSEGDKLIVIAGTKRVVLSAHLE